ncbi:hypothetical protein BDK51DRAFT_34747, partial [Blyttiomyces helicus]
LLAYGAICCTSERYEESRVYLVIATELQPKYVLGLTLLGLYYDVIEEEEDSENNLIDAAALHKATMPADAPSIFMAAAEFLIQCHAGQLAERALAQVLLRGPRVKPYLLLSQLEIQRSDYVRAAEYLNQALAVQQDEPNVWAAMGHLQYIQKLWDEAQTSFETVLTLPQEPTNVSLIYVRLGSIYLQNATSAKPIDASLARLGKSMYLRACELNGSSVSWLGVGKACLALKEFDEAEDALSEANVLNNRDSAVWAYLALLCLTLDRTFEANQCIAQALRLGIKDTTVLRQAGEAFLSKSQTNPAVECLRLCLTEQPDDLETQALFATALKAGSREALDAVDRDRVSSAGAADGLMAAITEAALPKGASRAALSSGAKGGLAM